MEKLLTVSVAAYNMEKYIAQCLDSLAIPEIVDELEVFVIDDGGTDATLEIGKRYAEKYPDTFIPVHKENGGYGTTVNYSIAHATGKYFRCLDGDDWFERRGFVQSLNALRETDADVVVMPSYHVTEDLEPHKDAFSQFCDGRKIQIKDLEGEQIFGIWSICYRTDILKQSGLELPSHMLFTDQYYSTIPFGSAETIQSIDAPVYCYRIGRDGQSVSRENRIRYTKENSEICLSLCEFYKKEKSLENENCSYLLRRVSHYYMNAVHTMLLHPINRESLRNLKNFDEKVCMNYPDIYECSMAGKSRMSLIMRSFRWTHYMSYWLLKLLPGGGPKLELNTFKIKRVPGACFYVS